MAYKDKHGIIKIKDSTHNNVSISCDYLNEEGEPVEKVPVLLFTPNMEDTSEHFHIVLDKKEAKKLNTWLTDYFKDNKKFNN